MLAPPRLFFYYNDTVYLWVVSTRTYPALLNQERWSHCMHVEATDMTHTVSGFNCAVPLYVECTNP